ncbi:hypothetical protein ERJ75_000904100 [Trypanosoma vivax]|nr:hypothetical protein ERJ75_000904100 [Trypanosoma vivax]
MWPLPNADRTVRPFPRASRKLRWVRGPPWCHPPSAPFVPPLAGSLSLVRSHACASIPVSRCLDAPSVGASRFAQPLRRVIDSARASVSAFTVRIGRPSERAPGLVLRFRRARTRGQPINGVERLAARPDRRCSRVSALQPARVACPLSRALVRTLAFCLRARVARSRGRPKYAKRGHRRTAPRRAGSLTCKTRNDPDKRMSAAPPSHGSARRVSTVWRGELGATPDTRFNLAATHSPAFRDNDGLTNCESVPADDARKAWVRRARALRDWLRVRPATTRRAGRASTARAYAARRYRTQQSGSGARGRADVAGKEEERHETRVLANTSGRRAGPSRSASPTSRKQYCAVTSQGAGGQGANVGDRKRSTQGYRTRTAEANGWHDCEHGLTPRWRSCCGSRLSLKTQNAGCCDSRRMARRGGRRGREKCSETKEHRSEGGCRGGGKTTCAWGFRKGTAP